jgi:hypothetical protein
MSDRIKELARQAGLIAPYGSDREGLRDFDYREFADMIVRDCMLICEDVMKKNNSALGCWSEIKRTFRS